MHERSLVFDDPLTHIRHFSRISFLTDFKKKEVINSSENRLFLLSYVLMSFLQIQLITSECQINPNQLYCFDKIAIQSGQHHDSWNGDHLLFNEIKFRSIKFEEMLKVFTKIDNRNNDRTERIIITNSTINSLPKDIFSNFTALQILDLSNNTITRIEDGAFNAPSKHLRFLDISFNNIKLLSYEFCSLNNLEFLNASNNLIQFISVGTFINFTSLTYLNLSYNSIDNLEIGTFEGLTNLRILDVSHNKLRFLNEKFLPPLLLLDCLYLDNNMLTKIDVVVLLSQRHSLRLISIHNNEWSCEMLLHMFQEISLFYFKVNFVRTLDYKKSNYKGYACQTQLNDINVTDVINNDAKKTKTIDHVKEFEQTSVISFGRVNTLLITICVFLFLLTMFLFILIIKTFYKTYNKRYNPSTYIHSDIEIM